MKSIAQHFVAELEAAGLIGLPFSWGDDGTFTFSDGMTDAQIEAVLTVYEAHDPAAVPVVSLPLSDISPRQIRQALTAAGLRTQVEAAVAAGDQNLKDWYEYSTTFERRNAQVLVMAAALGVSEQQLDELWVLGASL